MADFVQQSNVKSAVRELNTPLADVTTFNTIVQGVLTDNPFGCTAYETSSGQEPAMEKSREGYTARIVYQDDDAKTVGTITARAGTVAGFNTVKTEILGDAELTAALGGDPAADTEGERYSATIRCHDPSGEIYYVAFSRDEIRVTSYEDDSIVALVEAWADTVPALA